MKRNVLIVIISLLTGVILAGVFGTSFFSTYGFLNEYNLRSYCELNLNVEDVFCEILWERMKFFLCIFILGSTPFKRVVGKMLLIISGVIFGFLGYASIIALGGLGIVFWGLIFFPHGIIYFIGCYIVLKAKNYKYYAKNLILRNVLLYGVVILTLINGCLIETTISANAMKKILFIHFGDIIN